MATVLPAAPCRLPPGREQVRKVSEERAGRAHSPALQARLLLNGTGGWVRPPFLLLRNPSRGFAASLRPDAASV